MSVSVTSQRTVSSAALGLEDEGRGLSSAKSPCVLQQDPVSVTLDGPTIFLSAIALALVIHFSNPRNAEILVMLVPVILVVHNGYQNFLNLGPGGTPSTFVGFLKISWFSLWALRDPLTAPELRSAHLPKLGVLRSRLLPYRAGPRPTVVGIAPQRQLNQHGSQHCSRALRHSMIKLAGKNPNIFATQTSCVEKHGLALYARRPQRTSCQGEICHVHDADHSMHMCLHPDDIKEVLAKGWGQRHPLAFKGRFIESPVSEDFVMVYTPRDAEELQVVCNIIEAGIWHNIGEEVEMVTYLNAV